MARKRANGEGSITKIRAKGRKPYAAVVTVGWDLEGRPIRKARSASSQREAKALLAEMTAARDTHRPLPDDKMTVGKWLRSWYDSGDVRPNTVAQRRKVAQWALPGVKRQLHRRAGHNASRDADTASVPRGSSADTATSVRPSVPTDPSVRPPAARGKTNGLKATTKEDVLNGLSELFKAGRLTEDEYEKRRREISA